MRLVSIVLPTHNGARYLRESVDSCLRQTYTNFELIIVNDGSKDDTGAIADSYAAADPRVRVIHLNPNRKLPGALNAGFAATAGEYLTWTSDDNIFAPEALARMAAFLDQHAEVGLVYADYENIDAEGKSLGGGDRGPPEMLAYFGIVGACFMYRRAVMEAVGTYDDTMFCAEDYDYWLRIAARFPLAWIHERLYFYRIHGSSLSATQRTKMLRSMDGALTRSLALLPNLSRGARSKGYLTISSLRFQSRQLVSGMGYLCRAFFHSPGTVTRHMFAGVRRRVTS